MKDLLEAAQLAKANAYAPYSVYHVGAAFRGANGKTYAGCNVENISYGATICAERSALAAMVADGCTSWDEAVVVTKDGGTPCGICLQVMSEFCSDGRASVWTCGDESETKYEFATLLPFGFKSSLVQK